MSYVTNTARAPRLADLGADLIENGYKIIPIAPGTKSPNIKGWSQIDADRSHLQAWLDQGLSDWGVGVLGAETPGIDLDITDPAVLERVCTWCRENLGVAPVRIGRAPRRLLVYRTSSPFRKIKSPAFISPDGEKQQIEILGEGTQFVAFATHPDTGRDYEWPEGDLIDIPTDILCQISAEQCQQLVDYFVSIVPEGWRRLGELSAPVGDHVANPSQKASIRDVSQALEMLPNPDLDYDDWIRVGYAIKGALGEDHELEGCDLFHDWSARSDKYDHEVTQEAWDAIKDVKSIGAGTIFHLAEQHGWERSNPAAADEFEVVDVGEMIAQADRRQSGAARAGSRQILTYEQMASMPRPEWLVEGVIQKRTAALMFGRSNSFKSFLAVDIGLSVAVGQDWHGHGTEKGRVLLAATEGANGVGRQRVPGWFNHHRIEPGERQGVFLLPSEISLDVVGDVDWLVSEMLRLQIDLLVLDIFGGTMNGTEVEDTTARAWVRSVQRIIRETGATILTVAHTGWQDDTRARMHTHFWGSFDTRLRVEGDKQKLTTCLSVERHKDADSSGSWGFNLEPTGDTLVPVFDESIRASGRVKLSPSQQKAKEALDVAIAAHGEVRTGPDWPKCAFVREGFWEEACKAAGVSTSDNPDNIRRAFKRAVADLVQKGVVARKDQFYWDPFDVE